MISILARRSKTRKNPIKGGDPSWFASRAVSPNIFKMKFLRSKTPKNRLSKGETLLVRFARGLPQFRDVT